MAAQTDSSSLEERLARLEAQINSIVADNAAREQRRHWWSATGLLGVSMLLAVVAIAALLTGEVVLPGLRDLGSATSLSNGQRLYLWIIAACICWAMAAMLGAIWQAAMIRKKTIQVGSAILCAAGMCFLVAGAIVELPQLFC